eukprot:jgi/Mesvir1/10626/Mv01159-RA.1
MTLPSSSIPAIHPWSRPVRMISMTPSLGWRLRLTVQRDTGDLMAVNNLKVNGKISFQGGGTLATTNPLDIGRHRLYSTYTVLNGVPRSTLYMLEIGGRRPSERTRTPTS